MDKRKYAADDGQGKVCCRQWARESMLLTMGKGKYAVNEGQGEACVREGQGKVCINDVREEVCCRQRTRENMLSTKDKWKHVSTIGGRVLSTKMKKCTTIINIKELNMSNSFQNESYCFFINCLE